MRTALVVQFAAVCAFGQVPSTAPDISPATIRSTAHEVILDVVVRDKKGNLVRNLDLKDFVIAEDGFFQKPSTIRFIAGSAAATPGQTGKRLDPLRQIRLVTLVFDRLSSPDSRKLARQAALDFIAQNAGQNVFLSVFLVDQRLSVIQPFTSDAGLLRHAVAKAADGNFSQSGSGTDNLKKNLAIMYGGQERELEKTAMSGAGGSAPDTFNGGVSAADREVAEVLPQHG